MTPAARALRDLTLRSACDSLDSTRGRPASAHTAGMGFNPFGRRRRSASDYIFVAAGLLLTVALLLWAAGVV